MIEVRVQSGDFDPAAQLGRLEALNPAAISSLLILAAPPDEAAELLVDHYPAMAREELKRIAAEAAEKWPLQVVLIVHRHGRLARGARLALIAAAAPDRLTAIEACQYLARETARRGPFWRRDLPG